MKEPNVMQVLGVSMGQGQEIIARKYMATASQEGQWVLLQNTHLGLGYLTEVETFLVKEADSIHEDFRLWITAEPHPAFPIGLLQMGIKITNEAPVGMKAGLRASFQWVTQDMLDAVSRFEWRQLLFIQCYVHSVVQVHCFNYLSHPACLCFSMARAAVHKECHPAQEQQ
jgi:dynein heavy chain, axonemal